MGTIIIRPSTPEDLALAAEVRAAEEARLAGRAKHRADQVAKVSVVVLAELRELRDAHPAGYECKYQGGVDYNAFLAHLSAKFGQKWVTDYGEDALTALLNAGRIKEPVLALLEVIE